MFCFFLVVYDDVFSFQTHDQYHWDRFLGDCDPHVFHVAASAYKRMRDTDTDQVILMF